MVSNTSSKPKGNDSPNTNTEELFKDVENAWELNDLYEAYKKYLNENETTGKAKYIKITPKKKMYLRAILSTKSLKDIAKDCGDIRVGTVSGHWCDYIFPFVRKITGDEVKSWESVPRLLEQFKKPFKLESSYKEESHLPSLSEELSLTSPHINLKCLGRETDLDAIDQLVKDGNKVILIHAEGGVGKTTVAEEYFLTRGYQPILQLLMPKSENGQLKSVDVVLKQWQRTLDLSLSGKIEQNAISGDSLAQIKEKLKLVGKAGIFIDNLETALDGEGKFLDNSYVDLLRGLTDYDNASLTLITSRDSLNDSKFKFVKYNLPGLDLSVWKEIFKGIKYNEDDLSQLHQTFDGNAKAMQILRGAIFTDYNQKLSTYLKESKCIDNDENSLHLPLLKDLVSTQFSRLENKDPTAYLVLCRMGCYRYQSISSVPLKGISCLLEELSDEIEGRILPLLRGRALIEHDNSKFWLHSYIRAEALSRLKKLPEQWILANQKAAQFWTENIGINKGIQSIEDAKKALEAYYHYLNIEDWNKACEVILTKRDNNFEEKEFLGRSFYRVGLSKTIIDAIENILEKVTNDFYLCELYNLLGICYFFLGKFDQSVRRTKRAELLADKCLEIIASKENSINISNLLVDVIDIREVQLSSLITMLLCKMQFRETSEAEEVAKKLKSLTETLTREDGKLYAYKIYSWCTSAFLASTKKDFNSEAKEDANKVYEEYSNRQDNLALWKKLSAWGKGYTLLYLAATYENLKEFSNAKNIYKDALKYAKDSFYTQVEANALNGLAAIHRNNLEFDEAIENHEKAIVLLKQIGAECDLAEVYYQKGLTYKDKNTDEGDIENTIECFGEAYRLFSNLKATFQMQKVKDTVDTLPEKTRQDVIKSIEDQTKIES